MVDMVCGYNNKNFRALKSTAPLKPMPDEPAKATYSHFRALKNTAPLKQATTPMGMPNSTKFPCPKKHGPIEAILMVLNIV